MFRSGQEIASKVTVLFPYMPLTHLAPNSAALLQPSHEKRVSVSRTLLYTSSVNVAGSLGGGPNTSTGHGLALHLSEGLVFV